MAKKYTVDGFEAFQTLMPCLHERNVFMYFTASRNADGTSWCLDSAKAAPAIEAFAQGLDEEDTFVHCNVGDRPAWDQLLNPFRHLKFYRLTVLPTLIEKHSQKRLSKENCADPEKLREFHKMIGIQHRKGKEQFPEGRHKEWFTEDQNRFTALRKQARILHRKARAVDTPEAWRAYVDVQKTYRQLVKKAKNKYNAEMGIVTDAMKRNLEKRKQRKAEAEKKAAEGVGVSFVPPRWKEGHGSSTDPTPRCQDVLGKAGDSARSPPQQEIQGQYIPDQSWSDVLCHPAGNSNSIPPGSCNSAAVQTLVPPQWQQQVAQCSSTDPSQRCVGGRSGCPPVHPPPQQFIQGSSTRRGGSLIHPLWQPQHKYAGPGNSAGTSVRTFSQNATDCFVQPQSSSSLYALDPGVCVDPASQPQCRTMNHNNAPSSEDDLVALQLKMLQDMERIGRS